MQGHTLKSHTRAGSEPFGVARRAAADRQCGRDPGIDGTQSADEGSLGSRFPGSGRAISSHRGKTQTENYVEGQH
jgi:hypothetical protein